MAFAPDWVIPDWPAPANVGALITTRVGGVSRGPYGAPPHANGGMNLGFGSGDDALCVAENRARLRSLLPGDPRWLRQVHGATVVDAITVGDPLEADASFTNASGVVAVVLVADCMPVFFTDSHGRCVAVAHAGWRGMAAGVLQNTVRAMRARLGDADTVLIAYLGPAIGRQHFEVGSDVLSAMAASLPQAQAAFSPHGEGKYLADLGLLARQALEQVGVTRVYGGVDCTYADADRFYSHRRDRVTGRHAALIWRSAAGDRDA
jgi:polyphenol oxidase